MYQPLLHRSLPPTYRTVHRLYPSAAATPEEIEVADGITLVIGDISDDPAEIIEETQPLADYLAEELRDEGVAAVEVRVANSMEEMGQLLQNGDIDLYFAEAHGGKLWLQSAVGVGSVFRVLLPVTAREEIKKEESIDG
jgi:ABC-type phosphate/phosphonate transport system substrate-binding protein